MRPIIMMLIAAAFLVNAGCAKEKGSASAPGNTVCTTNCTGTTDSSTPVIPGNTTTYGAGEVTLTTSISKLSGLFFNSVPNSPQNIRVKINLASTADAVLIRYEENGVTKEAGFGSNHPYSSVSQSLSSGWFNHNGKPWWKGFFQDSYGAIVVVIDSTVNTGDGTPAEFVSGKVYFQNFCKTWPCNPYQGSEKMCWEISRGPYDCRTFISGDSINMASSEYPNNKGPDAVNSYQLLGTFTGLSRSAAGLPEM